jgi:peptide/nickel transport system permease protein
VYRIVIRRTLLSITVAITVSAIGFALLRLSGDLAQILAGQQATLEEVEVIRKAYGLDRPLQKQYLDWLKHMAVGDLGQSLFFQRPVASLLFERLPTTMILGCLSLALAMAIAVPLGIMGAIWKGSMVDRTALVLSSLGQSMPSFWVALLLVWLFGVTLQWTPISGSQGWRNFILPSITLAFYSLPIILRLTRAEMIEVLQSDYLRTARAKGLTRFSIVFKHALRNAMRPVVAVGAVQLGYLLGGSIVIETIFAINGIGYLAWESILRSDFPIVQSILVVVSLIYVIMTLAADLLNAVLDPRQRGI